MALVRDKKHVYKSDRRQGVLQGLLMAFNTFGMPDLGPEAFALSPEGSVGTALQNNLALGRNESLLAGLAGDMINLEGHLPLAGVPDIAGLGIDMLLDDGTMNPMAMMSLMDENGDIPVDALPPHLQKMVKSEMRKASGEDKGEPVYFGDVDGEFSKVKLQKNFTRWTLLSVFDPLFRNMSCLKRMVEMTTPSQQPMEFKDFFDTFVSHQPRETEPLMKCFGELYIALVNGDLDRVHYEMVQLNRLGVLTGKAPKTAAPAMRRGTNTLQILLPYFTARSYQLISGHEEPTAGDQIFYSPKERKSKLDKERNVYIYADMLLDRARAALASKRQSED